MLVFLHTCGGHFGPQDIADVEAIYPPEGRGLGGEVEVKGPVFRPTWATSSFLPPDIASCKPIACRENPCPTTFSTPPPLSCNRLSSTFLKRLSTQNHFRTLHTV